jgi:hypothetical protein
MEEVLKLCKELIRLLSVNGQPTMAVWAYFSFIQRLKQFFQSLFLRNRR